MMKLKRTPLTPEFDDEPTCVWEHPNGFRIVKEIWTNVGIRGGRQISYSVFQGDKLPQPYNGVRTCDFDTMRQARTACDDSRTWNELWDAWARPFQV